MSNCGSIWLSVLGALIPYSLGSMEVMHSSVKGNAKRECVCGGGDTPIVPSLTSFDFSLASAFVFLLALNAVLLLYPVW